MVSDIRLTSDYRQGSRPIAFHTPSAEGAAQCPCASRLRHHTFAASCPASGATAPSQAVRETVQARNDLQSPSRPDIYSAMTNGPQGGDASRLPRKASREGQHPPRAAIPRRTYPLLLFALLAAFLPEGIGAQYRLEWHVDGTVQGQYDDNINLSDEDPEGDFITTLSPGGQFLLETRTGRALLDYHLNAVFYASNPVLDYLGHQANLDAHQMLTKDLTFRLKDRFVRSDEPREVSFQEAPPEGGPQATEFLIGTRLQRSPYIRNNLNPYLEWRYGKDDILRVGYRNEIYIREVESTRDVRDTFSVGLDHWFGPKYGLGLKLDYLKAQFNSSSDFHGQDGLATFTRRLDPHTSVFLQTGISNRDFADQSTDYRVYKPSVGVEHAFSPVISGRLRAGYFFLVPEHGQDDGGLEGEASITVRWLHLLGTAYIRAGSTESYLDAENLGFAKYWATGGVVRYQATKMVSLGLDASLASYDFPSGQQRTTWHAKTDVSAALLRWLTGSIEFFHQEQQGEGTPGYTNNRVTFRLTARY